MAAPVSRADVARLLGSVGMFRCLDPAVLEELALSALPRTFARGQLLMVEGEPGESLLVITSGTVSVFRTALSGERAVLSVLRAPEALGEVALLDGAPRSASVEAMERTTVLSLSRPTFLALVRSQPALLDALLRSLGTMVRRLSDQAADHVFLDLAGRVAKVLVRLAGAASGPQPAVVDVTQGHLAEMAGATRQSVNQVLGVFAARGLVRIEGRRIVLLDAAGLRRRAHLPEPAPAPAPERRGVRVNRPARVPTAHR